MTDTTRPFSFDDLRELRGQAHRLHPQFQSTQPPAGAPSRSVASPPIAPQAEGRLRRSKHHADSRPSSPRRRTRSAPTGRRASRASAATASAAELRPPRRSTRPTLRRWLKRSVSPARLRWRLPLAKLPQPPEQTDDSSKVGDRIRFDTHSNLGIREDVVRQKFNQIMMREPYARNEELPALVLTRHSWCLERDGPRRNRWIVAYPALQDALVRAFNCSSERPSNSPGRVGTASFIDGRAVKVEKTDDNCVTMTWSSSE